MLKEIILELYAKYGQDWTGYLYRAGDAGLYYHTDAHGAEFYGAARVYECPDVEPVLIIDLNEVDGLSYVAKLRGVTVDELIEYDLALAIEETLPAIFKSYQAVVIDGETGRDVQGTPVEVAFPAPLQPTDAPEAIATLL
jgi:hypothetical protein